MSAPLLSGLADPIRVYSLSELHVLDDARLRELQHYELRGRAERTKVRVIRCRMTLVTTHTYLVSELHREI